MNATTFDLAISFDQEPVKEVEEVNYGAMKNDFTFFNENVSWLTKEHPLINSEKYDIAQYLRNLKGMIFSPLRSPPLFSTLELYKSEIILYIQNIRDAELFIEFILYCFCLVESIVHSLNLIENKASRIDVLESCYNLLISIEGITGKLKDMDSFIEIDYSTWAVIKEVHILKVIDVICDGLEDRQVELKEEAETKLAIHRVFVGLSDILFQIQSRDTGVIPQEMNDVYAGLCIISQSIKDINDRASILETCTSLIKNELEARQSNYMGRVMSENFLPDITSTLNLLSNLADDYGVVLVSQDHEEKPSPLLKRFEQCLNEITVETFNRVSKLGTYLKEGVTTKKQVQNLAEILFSKVKQYPTKTKLFAMTLNGIGELEGELSKLVLHLFNFAVEIFENRYKSDTDEVKNSLGFLGYLWTTGYLADDCIDTFVHIIDTLVNAINSNESQQDKTDDINILLHLIKLIAWKLNEGEKGEFGSAMAKIKNLELENSQHAMIQRLQENPFGY